MQRETMNLYAIEIVLFLNNTISEGILKGFCLEEFKR